MISAHKPGRFSWVRPAEPVEHRRRGSGGEPSGGDRRRSREQIVGRSRAVVQTARGRVHTVLQRAPELQGTDVSVRVEGSTVYLGGDVHTADWKQRIVHNVAYGFWGVTRVSVEAIDVRR